MLQGLQVFQKGLKGLQVARNEDLYHVLKSPPSKVWQIRVGLASSQQLDNDLGLVGQDSEVEGRVALQFRLEVGIGAMLDQVVQDLVVTQDNRHV